MIYDLDKTSKELFNFQLDDSQKQALETIIQFVSKKDKDDLVRVVSGEGGSGKSCVAACLIKVLEQNNYMTYVVTPTNKSKNVLGQFLNDPEKVMTIHSFLNLKPDLNILNFDAKHLQFSFGFNDFQPVPFSVYLVDEGSMINNELYDVLKEKAKKNRNKIIIFCDSKQLSPVKQDDISKILNSETITLRTIHRQDDDNDLHDILKTLRSKPIYKFKKPSNNLIIYDNFKELLLEKSPIFKLAADLKDPNVIKIITYTNKRIEALNTIVRKIIYNNNLEYNYGEILTAYDTCKCDGYCDISNSSDYIVYKCHPTKWRNFNAWCLELFDIETNKNKLALVLSKDNPQWMFDGLAVEIENLRLKAIEYKSSKIWRQYFKLNEAFFTPVDLIYQDRIIKRKSLDYGYSISAHRSQGSTYSAVIVDLENLLTCKNSETLRQLEYVALSRTTSDVYLYQK